MGRPRYDSGFCFDAASAPDRRRLSGPAVSALPGDWGTPAAPGGTITTPWIGPDFGNTVEIWKDANGYTGGKVSGTGDDITQDTPAPGTATLDDAAGAFTAAMVGRNIAIAGAAAPANDGTFLITAVNSATQLEYTNAAAVTVVGDAFTYDVNPSDNGYGAAPEPTKSWRFDVDLPAGWYTRSTISKKHSGQQ